MANWSRELSIMSYENQKESFSKIGCKFMQLIMTSSPISLPAGYSDIHDFYEFLVPLTDLPAFFIEDQDIPCGPGSLVTINPGQRHGVRQENNNVAYIMILFEKETMRQMIRQVHCEGINDRFPMAAIAMSSDIQLLIMRIIQEKRDRNKGGEIILQCMADEMAVLLARHCFLPDHRAPDEGSGLDFLNERQARFSETVAFMQRNFAGRVTIDELATITGMNSFHFIRCFKRLFNISPYNYLTRIRICNAKRLLLQSDLPAAVIGRTCGFQSASRFSAVFQRETGMTPSRFRKENGDISEALLH